MVALSKHHYSCSLHWFNQCLNLKKMKNVWSQIKQTRPSNFLSLEIVGRGSETQQIQMAAH